MSERIVVLVNRRAGRAGNLPRRAEVEQALARRGSVAIVEPADAVALAAAAAAASRAGATLVVAGGDGTVNRAVTAMRNAPVPLGILPLGSGNDLARALRIPTDIVEAAGQIAGSRGRAMDLVEISGAVCCCTVGGLGLVADVTARVARRSEPGRWSRPFVQALGQYAYLLSATLRILSPATRPRTVRLEGESASGRWQWTGPCHALFLANHPTLGAGLRLPVPSASDDGEIEVCVVPHRARLSLAIRLAALRTGRSVPEDVLTVRRASRVVIELEEASPLAADGDIVCAGRRFDVVVRPRALTIL